MVSEYDAFGPWIYEIDGEHPIPRLFVPYFQDTETPLMLLKVPRDISRQAASPDMDLYDYMIGAYGDHIRLLKREEASVREIQVPYEDIEGLRLQRHFIKGLMTLYLPNDTLTISFNASSINVVKGLFRLIRDRYTSELAADRPPLVRPAGLDALYINLLNDMEAEGERPWRCAYQPLIERKMGPFSKYLAPKVPAAMHILLPRELLVIQQEPLPGADWKYNYHHTFFPLSRLEMFSIVEEPSKGSPYCVLRLPHHEISYVFGAENPDIRGFYDAARQARSAGGSLCQNR